jgi:nitronate monooxygenase
MWAKTQFSELLGIDWPIVQGPFGGGTSTVALAAAVSNGGGLGSFGAVDFLPEDITRIVRELGQATRWPFAINLWVPMSRPGEVVPCSHELSRVQASLRPYYAALGTEPPALTSTRPAFERQIEALLEARPPVFSFVMGVPDVAILREARRRGIHTLGTATTVEEAQLLEEAGTDVVIASGSDAGGHRGSFLRPVEESLVGTFSLVPQVVRAVQIPVVAAGGIADGAGVAAALALGAQGVQIGTAFLACSESPIAPAYRERLGRPDARRTRLTRAFSGRPARGIENELMRALERAGEPLPYPWQNSLTAPLRRAASAANQSEWLSLWAGQNAASARGGSAMELLGTLVEETDRVLGAPRLAPRMGHPLRGWFRERTYYLDAVD